MGLLLLLLVTVLVNMPGSRGYVTEEENLRNTLFTSYTSSVKPNQTTDVMVLMMPLSLNELNIAQQKMSMTASVAFIWSDWRLAWDPTLYGNINSITVEPSSIWTPDVVVENAMEDVGAIGATTTVGVKARVSSTGSVQWFPPLQLSVAVDVKIANYPFDTQDCSIRLILWGELESEVNLTVFSLGGVDTTYLADNGEWDLKGTSTTSSYFVYGPGQNFKRLDFTYTFRRKWQFYGMNMVMPIVLTSILMCAVFALPIESGEKMGFSLTVLLSYVVFLTWVTDNLPPVSTDTSVLQVYVALVLCLGVVATLLTMWVLHLYHRDQNLPVSPAMRVFVTKVLVPLKTLNCARKASESARRDVRRASADTLSVLKWGTKVSHRDVTTRRERADTEEGQGDPARLYTGKPYVQQDLEEAEPDPAPLYTSRPDLQPVDKGKPLGPAETHTHTDSVDKVKGQSAPDGVSTPPGGEDKDLTWAEVASMMDRFFMVVISGVTLVSTVVILAILYSNF